jgi:hypothetical protein
MLVFIIYSIYVHTSHTFCIKLNYILREGGGGILYIERGGEGYRYIEIDRKIDR